MSAASPQKDSQDLNRIQDRETLLTPETFEMLGRVLSIRWPAWYREFIATLLQAQLSRDFWLQPGWLYGRTAWIYADTLMYRTGGAQFCAPRDERQRPRPIPWPPAYVVVGDVNAGDRIAIDTDSSEWIFLHIDWETGVPTMLFDGRTVASSPEALARALIGPSASR